MFYSHQNKLKDKDDVYSFFLDRPHVLSRVNRHVLAKSEVVDLSYPGKYMIACSLHIMTGSGISFTVTSKRPSRPSCNFSSTG